MSTALAEDYVPLARSIAWRFKQQNSWMEWEELGGAAAEFLVIASQKYDSERGAFVPFVRKVITRKLIDYIDHQRTQPACVDLSVVDDLVWQDGGFVDVEVRCFLGSLAEVERVLVGLRLKGKTQKECGAILTKRFGHHYGQKEVSLLLARMQQKYLEFFEEKEDFDAIDISSVGA